MTAKATGVAYGGDRLHLPRRLTNSDRKESSTATTCHNKSTTGVREGAFGSACVGGGRNRAPAVVFDTTATTCTQQRQATARHKRKGSP
jgi:formylmethanofuran dehydrogenase subunit B